MGEEGWTALPRYSCLPQSWFWITYEELELLTFPRLDLSSDSPWCPFQLNPGAPRV